MDAIEMIKNSISTCNADLALFVCWLALRGYELDEIAIMTQISKNSVIRYIYLVRSAMQRIEKRENI